MSASPTTKPTSAPTYVPGSPTPEPTSIPTYLPGKPTPVPTFKPTSKPTLQPTGQDILTELLALQELYNELDGPSWKYPQINSIVWNFTCAFAISNPCNPCTWSGLLCTVSNGLTYIQSIILNNYGLTGSLPNVFNNFIQLKILNLDNSPKTIGTISSSLFTLSKLSKLSLQNISLTGTLPIGLFSLPSLSEISITYTKIYGTIPTEIGNLKSLTKITFFYNSLSGTIPTEIGLCTNITYVLARNMQLSGTLPSELGRLTKATYFNVRSNYLSGTIPLSIGNMKNVDNFNLRNNMLTGTIPTSFCNFNVVRYFYVSVNSLTGPIPECFNYTKIIFFFMYDNRLSGTIPSFLKNANDIEQLLLQSNNFKGSLNSVFDGTNNYNRLSTIDVSNNDITGEIPDVLFSYPNLEVLNIGSNCFLQSKFPISSVICQAPRLQSLILDGFSTGKACPNLDYDAYLIGSIPTCIFTMAYLQTLHLSGIGLRTKFPELENVTSSLQILSLPYNMISGTIPTVIQTHNFNYLDLSHNKLTGSLSSNLSTALNDNFCAVDNNRLSGEIWPSLNDAKNISILRSNMFSCPNGKPKYDPAYEDYSCGSSTLNIFLYMSLGLMLAFILFLLYRILYGLGYKNLLKWYNLSKSEVVSGLDCRSVRFLSSILDKFRFCCFAIIVYTMFILQPIFLVLSQFYKTFAYQYEWTVGGFFFQGSVPTSAQFVLFLVFVLIVDYISHSLVNIDKKWKQKVRDEVRIDTGSSSVVRDSMRLTDVNSNKKAHSIDWLNKRALSYFLAFIINGIVFGGINILFIYIQLHGSKSVVTFSIFTFGALKACYKRKVIMATLRCTKWIALKIKYYGATLDEADSDWIYTFSNKDLFMSSVLQITSTIAIPWIAILFETEQCFYGKFFYRKAITVTYPIKYCATRCTGSLDCCVYDTMGDQFTFTPAYVYYSNCSNFLLTSYIPVMFTTFAITSVMYPTALIIQDYFVDKYYKVPENPTTFEKTCSSLANYQLRIQYYFMYITPTQLLEASRGKPKQVLEINRSLLTWSTNLGNSTIIYHYYTSLSHHHFTSFTSHYLFIWRLLPAPSFSWCHVHCYGHLNHSDRNRSLD